MQGGRRMGWAGRVGGSRVGAGRTGWWPVAAVCCGCLAATAQQPSVRSLQQANAAFHAGYAALEAQKLDVARADFARVVKLAPTLPEGHMALGAVLVQLGRVQEAIPELKQALALKPGDAGIRNNLAQAYVAEARSAGSAAAAEAAMEQAVEANPGDPTLEDKLGSLLGQQKQWPQAEAAFRKALALSGAEPGADAGQTALEHMHLGVVLAEEQQMTDAEQELRTATQMQPANAEMAYQLGLLLSREERDEEAVVPLEMAVHAATGVPPGADLALAMSYQRLGRQLEAIPYFEKAVAADPKDASALNNLGLALTETGKAKEAIPYFERALAEKSGDAVLHEDLGVAYIQMSDFAGAIGEFEAAEKLDGKNPELHYDLGLAYKLKDRMDDAVSELKQAAALDPRLPDPPYTLGVLEMQMGRLPEAADALRTALALRPQNGDGWAILGSVLHELHQSAEAERALRRAMELMPSQPGPRITLAAVLAEEGRQAEARELRKQAAELTRVAVNRQRATFSVNAGNQLLLRGQIADAVGRFQEAVAADPGFAEAHRQLALGYERQGRTAEAATERATAARLEAAGGTAAPISAGQQVPEHPNAAQPDAAQPNASQPNLPQPQVSQPGSSQPAKFTPAAVSSAAAVCRAGFRT